MSIPIERLEGKYEILEKIREGGMGAVYKVRHRLLDEVRVIKVMRPHLAEDEVLRARFFREAKTAIRLRHHNLAQFYDFTMDDDGTSFIVMEFIDGVNLHELTEILGRPSLALVLEIAEQTLDVLGHLHRRQVVHRDIAPDNLMLSRDEDNEPVVKMIDLGIAKTLDTSDGLTKTGTFIGKLRYCSPEHFQSAEGGKIDPRSDLYSFGIVLYELLTGTHPIQGKSTSGLITGHLVKPPVGFDTSDPKGEVPDDLRALILKALAKKLDDRFADAAEFRKAIRSVKQRYEVDPDEIARLFEKRTSSGVRVARPGSTQDRLDRRFGMASTPPPGGGAEFQTAAAQVPPPAVAAEDAKRAKEQARVAALVDGARQLLDLKSYDEARKQLTSALELDPSSDDAQQLLASVDAAQAEERRQTERAGIVEEVAALLDAGEIATAAEQLMAAVNRLGTAPEFNQLQARIEGALEKARKRDERVKERLARARKLIDGGSSSEAVELLQLALADDPSSSEVQSLLGEAQEAERKQLEEKRRAQEIANTCASIAAQLEREQPDEAEHALGLARKLYGDIKAFATLQSQIDLLRQRQLEARVEELRGEAATLIEQSDFEAALQRLEEALKLAPGDPKSSEIQNRAKEGLERQRVVAEAIEGIERLILAGRLETAFARIDTALEEHGDFPEAATLKQRIEQEVVLRRERETEAWAVLQKARSLAEEGKFDAAEKTLEEARGFEAEHPEVHELIHETEQAIKRRVEEERRAQVVAQAVASIEKSIQDGALDKAEREIEVAQRVCGPQELFTSLGEKIKELRLKERQAQVEKLLVEALGKQASFKEVIAKLEQALEIDPTNDKVQKLLAETRGALHRYEQERRFKAIAEAMAEIDELIIASQLGKALKRLDAIVEEHGQFKEARTVRPRLQAMIGSAKKK